MQSAFLKNAWHADCIAYRKFEKDNALYSIAEPSREKGERSKEETRLSTRTLCINISRRLMLPFAPPPNDNACKINQG